jgi:F-type H+-transporting ATPase subunit delta
VRTGRLSRRYAKALVEIAAERAELEAVGQDLRAMSRLLTQNRDAMVFFGNPGAPMAAKRRALQELAERAGLGRLTVNFLLLILAKRRLQHLEAIALAYEEQMDDRLNRARATITSAAPLPDATLETLKGRLGQATGKEISMETRVDPAILGGVVARVGSTVYDGSLKAQLRRMREHLLKG